MASNAQHCDVPACCSADSEQFTVENDLITPTFKFKRPQLQRRYQADIDIMYRALRGNSCVSSYAPSRAVSRETSRRVSKVAAEVEVPHVVAKAH